MTVTLIWAGRTLKVQRGPVDGLALRRGLIIHGKRGASAFSIFTAMDAGVIRGDTAHDRKAGCGFFLVGCTYKPWPIKEGQRGRHSKVAWEAAR